MGEGLGGDVVRASARWPTRRGAMATLLLAEAAEMDQRRMALSRYALVWWQGEAAEAYQRRVQERVARWPRPRRGWRRRPESWEALEEAADDAALAEAGLAVGTREAGRAVGGAGSPPPPARGAGRRDARRRAPARGALARAGPVRVRRPGDLVLASQWARVDARDAGGRRARAALWGEALALEVLAVRLRAAARVYAGVEASVSAVLAGVGAGADLAARGGWLTDGPSMPAVTAGAHRPWWSTGTTASAVPPTSSRPARGSTVAGSGSSRWCAVTAGRPGWWSCRAPRSGRPTPERTRSTSPPTSAASPATPRSPRPGWPRPSRWPGRGPVSRSTPADPVVLVGHSQGGILAAALASDPGFTRRNRVSHVVTSGSPVALFPVPPTTRVLSVERGDDPVPRLDLTPQPRPRVVGHRAHPARRSPVDVRDHALEGYVATLRVAEAAPRGTVAGLDAWQASAGGVLGRPVRSVSELRVERGWQNHAREPVLRPRDGAGRRAGARTASARSCSAPAPGRHRWPTPCSRPSGPAGSGCTCGSTSAAPGSSRSGWPAGSGAPVAVMTTSGTAVANLHPAVLEAHHAGVPLVVVSADRPHELRGTGANQTTEQPGIFGCEHPVRRRPPGAGRPSRARPVLAQHRLPRARGRHRRHRWPARAGAPQRLPARATGPRARGHLRRRVGHREPRGGRRVAGRPRGPGRRRAVGGRWATAGRGPRKRPRSPRWRERWSSSASPATPHSANVPSPGRPSAATPSWPSRSAAPRSGPRPCPTVRCCSRPRTGSTPTPRTESSWSAGRPCRARSAPCCAAPGCASRWCRRAASGPTRRTSPPPCTPRTPFASVAPPRPVTTTAGARAWRTRRETRRGCRCRAAVPVAEWPRRRERRRRRAPGRRRARPRLEQPRA